MLAVDGATSGAVAILIEGSGEAAVGSLVSPVAMAQETKRAASLRLAMDLSKRAPLDRMSWFKRISRHTVTNSCRVKKFTSTGFMRVVYDYFETLVECRRDMKPRSVRTVVVTILGGRCCKGCKVA